MSPFVQNQVLPCFVPSIASFSTTGGSDAAWPTFVWPEVDLDPLQVARYAHEASKVEAMLARELAWLSKTDEELVDWRKGRYDFERLPHAIPLLSETKERILKLQALCRNKNQKVKENAAKAPVPDATDPAFVVEHRAMQFRLYPNRRENIKFCRFAGGRRFMFNLSIEQHEQCKGRNLDWFMRSDPFTYERQCRELTELRRLEECRWMKEVHSQVLQQALADADDAMQRFFEGKAGFPRRGKKGRDDSFRYPTPLKMRRTGHKSGQIQLPKIGWVSFRGWRALPGRMLSVTVFRRAGLWYASMQCEVIRPAVPPSDKPSLGIDVNVVNHYADSEGNIVPSGLFAQKARKRMVKAQRALSRKDEARKANAKKALKEKRVQTEEEKWSHNRTKAKYRLQRVHKEIADARLDFNHQQSCQVTQNHGTIFMEDLKLKNMTASAKGTAENPGKNVRQKAGLNRALLNQGHGQFRRFIGYKAKSLGGELVLVPPHYSSQDCSQCDHRAAENRPSQAVFKCVACGFECNADVNAACNHRKRGLKLVAERPEKPPVSAAKKKRRKSYRKRAKGTPEQDAKQQDQERRSDCALKPAEPSVLNTAVKQEPNPPSLSGEPSGLKPAGGCQKGPTYPQGSPPARQTVPLLMERPYNADD